MIPADKTLCLAHEHDKTPRNPRVLPDFCQRLATCARHQAISHVQLDGSHHVKPRVCQAGQHDAFVAIVGADSEGCTACTELEQLREELAAANAEIAMLKTTPPHKRQDLHCVAYDLCEQVLERDKKLAAAHLVIEQKQKALENIRLFSARHRKEEWAAHVLRFCSEGGATGSPMRSTEALVERDRKRDAAQFAERDKIIALAREAISYALRKDYNCNGITCAKNLEEALAAIDDSKLVAGMVLCSTKRDRKRDAALLREADKVWWELDYGSFEKLAKARESGDWEPELEVK